MFDRSLREDAWIALTEIDGREYRQGPFKYQGKCLMWMREAHAGLADGDRACVDRLLAGTGCEPLFA